MSRLEHNDVVLFQGDSITDAGRDLNKPGDLGKGYALMTAGWFGMNFPEKNVTFLNRGISGNRVSDLRERWQEDCLELKPTWVSVYIGINDCWRRYDRNDPTDPESFKAGYRELLERTARTGARLILIEPFVLPYPEDRKAWREDLDPKIHAVRELSAEFGAPLVPLDGLFARAASVREPSFWTLDGVHPTPAGHALIADAWLQTMGLSRS
ncbi:SGNH/GDSL hydrolase family protein [Paenibacillus sp. XY044]|uniref:SGNH/GDSL hydrolase family protein n=1 Tax=Paenibacillus sp. XY044 TaxID=2026089 RepID=UPI000B998F10|nr:SGNH/GDSL hydrolase family protein [Paenibacillus sp. XY044]OZB98654.1 GDSL family lipase [Paenibacillus sp. XY044]